MTIQCNNLSKIYPGDVKALTGLNLSVEKGKVFGLLGPNGAGKTTTVRLLNGTISPTKGTSSILGLPSGDASIRLKSATMAESARMYDQLTAYENLKFFANIYDIPQNEVDSRISSLLKRMGLSDKAGVKLGSFSTGMMKRLQLARALLHNPELLFLDEPTSGLDPDSASQVITLIRKLSDETGVTVFLCTHNLHLAERICDGYGLLKEGTLVATGTRDELITGIVESPELIIETSKGNKSFEVDSESDINPHIQQVIDSGEIIYSVNMKQPTLEDVYFHYIGRRENELE